MNRNFSKKDNRKKKKQSNDAVHAAQIMGSMIFLKI